MDPGSMYAEIGATMGLATVALILRNFARRMTKAGHSYDDALAVVAYVRSPPCLQGLFTYGSSLQAWAVAYCAVIVVCESGHRGIGH